MPQRLQNFVNQLSQKTREGKLFWSPGFDDGQFMATVAPTSAAFVIHLQGSQRRLQVLDEQQQTILDEPITKAAFDDILGPLAPDGPEAPQQDDTNGHNPLDLSLEKAEKLLAAV
jgi:hypothetical protein